MRIHQRFCTWVAVAALFAGTIAMSKAAPATVLVHDSPWSLAGASTNSGFFTNFLLLPLVNPQTLNTPSSVIFGNTITSGSGHDVFHAHVDVIFDVTQNGHTDTFDATGMITGKISDAKSNAHVAFASLTDTTTGQVATVPSFTDPGSHQAALFLKTHVGGVYFDFTQPIPTPTQNQSTLSGFIAPVPEMGTSLSLAVMMGGGLIGSVKRRRRK